jgi:hypothetical protein
MKLSLFHRKTVQEAKHEFSRNFRFLKIEFFNQKHGREKGSAFDRTLADDLRLSEAVGNCKEGVFHFTPLTTVAEFEQRLQSEFGLPVQVFRKSGDTWIETVQTDKLTLETQNSMGEAAATPLRFNMNSLFL